MRPYIYLYQGPADISAGTTCIRGTTDPIDAPYCLSHPYKVDRGTHKRNTGSHIASMGHENYWHPTCLWTAPPRYQRHRPCAEGYLTGLPGNSRDVRYYECQVPTARPAFQLFLAITAGNSLIYYTSVGLNISPSGMPFRY